MGPVLRVEGLAPTDEARAKAKIGLSWAPQLADRDAGAWTGRQIKHPNWGGPQPPQSGSSGGAAAVLGGNWRAPVQFVARAQAQNVMRNVSEAVRGAPSRHMAAVAVWWAEPEVA